VLEPEVQVANDDRRPPFGEDLRGQRDGTVLPVASHRSTISVAAYPAWAAPVPCSPQVRFRGLSDPNLIIDLRDGRNRYPLRRRQIVIMAREPASSRSPAVVAVAALGADLQRAEVAANLCLTPHTCTSATKRWASAVGRKSSFQAPGWSCGEHPPGPGAVRRGRRARQGSSAFLTGSPAGER
jgi:hypothetical protein